MRRPSPRATCAQSPTGRRRVSGGGPAARRRRRRASAERPRRGRGRPPPHPRRSGGLSSPKNATAEPATKPEDRAGGEEPREVGRAAGCVHGSHGYLRPAVPQPRGGAHPGTLRATNDHDMNTQRRTPRCRMPWPASSPPSPGSRLGTSSPPSWTPAPPRCSPSGRPSSTPPRPRSRSGPSRTFGTADKPILLGSVALVTLLAAAVVGLLARRRPRARARPPRPADRPRRRRGPHPARRRPARRASPPCGRARGRRRPAVLLAPGWRRSRRRPTPTGTRPARADASRARPWRARHTRRRRRARRRGARSCSVPPG